MHRGAHSYSGGCIEGVILHTRTQLHSIQERDARKLT